MTERTGPDVLEAMRRYWLLVLVCTVVGICLSGAVALLVRGSGAYAEGTVALTAPSQISVIAPGAQGDATLARYTSQRALFMQSDSVLATARQQVPPMDISSLREALSVQPSQTSTSVVVRAEASTVREATALVDAVVEAYRLETLRQVADRTSAALDSIAEDVTELRQTLAANPTQAVAQSAATALAELTQQASALQADSAVYADGVEFVQAPSSESSGSSPAPVREMVLGGLLGFAIGATWAWLRADSRPLATTPSHVGSILGVEQLGTGPLPEWNAGMGDEKHVMVTRHARNVLAPLLKEGVPRVILVTGPLSSGDASTSLALGLTTALAVEGYSPLIVDGDPSAPGVTEALGGATRALGFLDTVLDDQLDPRDAAYEHEAASGVKVTVMPAGQPAVHDPQIPVAAVRSGIDRLRACFDVVIMNVPLSDGVLLSAAVSGSVDAVIVVVRKGTPEQEVRELRQHLAVNDAPLVGYVFDEGRRAPVLPPWRDAAKEDVPTHA